MSSDFDKGSMADQLATWWRKTAEEEIDQTVAKAVEYSASDLLDIGRGVLGEGHSDEFYYEAGIAFYLLGKISRIMGAIREGRRPSYDSWFDAGIYARMGQRVKEVGSWPGTKEESLIVMRNGNGDIVRVSDDPLDHIDFEDTRRVE